MRAGLAVAAVVLVGIGLLVVTGSPDEDRPEPPASAAPSSSAAPAGSPGTGTPPPPGAVDVRDFGATGDGVTDDAPALRRALAEATSVHVSAGTYLLSSYATPRDDVVGADFVFQLRDGQTITADPGAVLVMADGVIAASKAAWGGNVFLGDSVSGVTISGLTIDLNGPGNLVPARRTITGYGLYLFAAQDVTLDGVTMRDTPGQNYVVAQGGGSGITVRDSSFLNGGTSVPGNRNQDDFSALYFTASDVTVERIVIDHDQQPFGFSGGVELHGAREAVTGSVINDSWPAVYIGPDVASDLRLQDQITVSGNRFLDCGRGVVFNALGTGEIEGVDISDNEFRMVGFAAFPGEPTRAVDQDMPPDGNWTYHHLITGLTVRGNTVTGNGAWSDAVVRLSQVHGATITGNRLDGVVGSALVLFSSPWDTTDVVFSDNDVTWRPSRGAPLLALSLDGSSTDPPRRAFDARNISLADNRVVVTGDGGGSCAVHAEWPATAEVDDVEVRGNDLQGVEDAVCGPQADELTVGP
ncbi:glycosyl hydrolase family 28-related protein [Modestobacter excelsi]|uniref:glycosyl hydrolase family 28-related protein n=1 Tax=Modestobacter excelsi TaxID=2213161 RepID=UPI00110CA713|nr:glycosyl hydrolase family 28-related protein [Modestobacter excelsi]